MRKVATLIKELILSSQNHDDPKIKEIITSLDTFTAEELRNVMLRIIENIDTSRKISLTELLLRHDSKKFVPTISHLLMDVDPEVRYSISGLLHDFGDSRVTPQLMNVIQNDPVGNVRFIACWALGQIGDKRALPILQHVLQDDDGIDYEGRPIRDEARIAIREILEREGQ